MENGPGSENKSGVPVRPPVSYDDDSQQRVFNSGSGLLIGRYIPGITDALTDHNLDSGSRSLERVCELVEYRRIGAGNGLGSRSLRPRPVRLSGSSDYLESWCDHFLGDWRIPDSKTASSLVEVLDPGDAVPRPR